jgi:hypothetical protein
MNMQPAITKKLPSTIPAEAMKKLGIMLMWRSSDTLVTLKDGIFLLLP